MWLVQRAGRNGDSLAAFFLEEEIGSAFAADGEAKFLVGTLLATFGEVEPAIELARQALATEPLRADWYTRLAMYLLGRNQLDGAEQAIRRAIELQPGASGTHGILAFIEIKRGHPQAAIAAAQHEVPGVTQEVALAFALQIGGSQSAADAALRKLIDDWGGGAAYQIAEIYGLRNDVTATFEWLDRAWNNRDPGIGFLLNDPFIHPYKDDPRFAAFCRKVGLPVPRDAVRKSA